jgi:hypothetical protein
MCPCGSDVRNWHCGGYHKSSLTWRKDLVRPLTVLDTCELRETAESVSAPGLRMAESAGVAKFKILP